MEDKREEKKCKKDKINHQVEFTYCLDIKLLEFKQKDYLHVHGI